MDVSDCGGGGLLAPEEAAVQEGWLVGDPDTIGKHYEDHWFRQGPGDDAFPWGTVDEARFGLPTCWDQWFRDLARAYSLAGADVLGYPTAIGSEPGRPRALTPSRSGRRRGRATHLFGGASTLRGAGLGGGTPWVVCRRWCGKRG
ncbi:nitrilase-related carbon-nitrogen hydrolase [Streptomyces decoyicus]